MCLNRSDSDGKKQHRIFDLIEIGNSVDEAVMDSSYASEIEVLESNEAVLSPEIITIKSSTEGIEQVKELSKGMKHSEENEKHVNSNHANGFVPLAAGFISVVEDVGGKCLFSIKTNMYFIYSCSVRYSCCKLSWKPNEGRARRGVELEGDVFTSSV